MGYRSSVRIVMSKNGYSEFQKYVEDHNKEYVDKNISKDSIIYSLGHDFNLLHRLNINKESNKDNLIYIGWDEIKWYDGFEEVDSIMDSLNKLKKNGYGFSFSRLGESVDDYEEISADYSKKDEVKSIKEPVLVREFDDNSFEIRDKSIERDER